MNSARQASPQQPGYRGWRSLQRPAKVWGCWGRWLGRLLVGGVLAGGAGLVVAKGPNSPHGENSPAAVTIALADLPAQGRQTYALIAKGGPFPFDKDGTVFGNRERLLPRQKNGYYLEYTVKTPGLRSRGAQRIVCGGKPRQPDACYFTADHYGSFRRIVN